MSVPVVLDCDTGTDDAVAIMVAALHPDLELLGVTTVWGNHDVRHTTDNSLRVLDLVGRGGASAGSACTRVQRSGPAAPGGAAERTRGPASHARDPRAVGGRRQPRGRVAGRDAPRHDPARRARPHRPLTNLAAALAADPGIVEAVERLVVLGGTHRERGVTPYAERNVWCDPEAAHDVLTAGFRDVLLVTMDATFSAPLTAADTARLRARRNGCREHRGRLRRRPDRLVPPGPGDGRARGGAAARPAGGRLPARPGRRGGRGRLGHGGADRPDDVRRHPLLRSPARSRSARPSGSR